MTSSWPRNVLRWKEIMQVTRFRLIAAFATAATLTFPQLSSAHSKDPLEHATTAPAPGAQLEGVSGTVHELVIEDRVAKMTMRYLSVRSTTGAATALLGAGVGELTNGATVSVVGKRNGNVLFVESIPQNIAAKAAVKDAASARAEGTL